MADEVRVAPAPRVGTRALLVVALVLASQPLCAGDAVSAPGARRTNVLLVSLDTTRRDFLSCYGYPQRTTPHIDALADEGLVFTRAIATSNWTLPTHASMLTGLYPTSHGAHSATSFGPHLDVNKNHPATAMVAACDTLAEVLGRSGYRTGAILANHWWLKSLFGLDQGFETFDAAPAKASAADKYPTRTAAEIADAAIDWLKKPDPRPFLLVLNLIDPHAPYAPPAPFDEKFLTKESAARAAEVVRRYDELRISKWSESVPRDALEWSVFRARYAGEIAYADEQLGRVLQALRDARLDDDTLVIVTGDHGEALGEHGLTGHTHLLYEPEVAVPLIIRLPQRARRGRPDLLASHVDIMPTVLDVLGLEAPPGLQGRSLLRPGRGLVVSESHPTPWPKYRTMQRALYLGSLKLIENGDARELFDLAADPHEQANLIASRPEAARALAAALEAWGKATQPLGAAKAPALDPETLEKLRSLGYIE